MDDDSVQVGERSVEQETQIGRISPAPSGVKQVMLPFRPVEAMIACTAAGWT